MAHDSQFAPRFTLDGSQFTSQFTACSCLRGLQFDLQFVTMKLADLPHSPIRTPHLNFDFEVRTDKLAGSKEQLRSKQN